MSALFLIGAVAVTAGALLFLIWRIMDNRVRMAYGDQTREALAERVQDVLQEQQHLRKRVEALETIIAAEPWERSLGASARLSEKAR